MMQRITSIRLTRLGVLLALLVMLIALGVQSSSASAQSSTITLDFSSLPSAQGWTYITGNSSIQEASIFSVSGGMLHMDSMSVGYNAAMYRLFNVVDPDLPFILSARVRILDYVVQSNENPWGMAIGAELGSQQFAVAISPGRIVVDNQVMDSTTDVFQFHDYRLESRPGSLVEFFIDNVSVGTVPPIYDNVPNAIFLGDSTAGANAKAEIASFSFTQYSVNNPPVVSVAQPSVAVDEGLAAINSGNVSDVDGDVVALAASVGLVVNNGNGTWSWSFTPSDGPAQSQTVTVEANDGNGGTAQASFGLTVNNVPPAANAGPDQAVFRNDPVNVSGSWSDPAGSADDPYTWSWDLSGSSSSGSASYGSTANASTSFAQEGQYTLTVQVSDKDGGSSSDTLLVNVQNRPPECSAVTLSLDFLWPAQHQMVQVAIQGATDPEGDPVALTITSIFQDEPTNGLGDGDTSPDAEGIGTNVATVRAERGGTGNGRIYHINYSVNDGHGGSCTGTATVGVNHDQGNKGRAVDDGPQYDSTQP